MEQWILEGTYNSKELRLIASAWANDELHVEFQKGYWKGDCGLFTWQGEFGLLDKVSILGEDWPDVPTVLAVLNMGGHLQDVLDNMEAFLERLTKDNHLVKHAWCIELNTERYEHARSLSRSPEVVDDQSSPSRSSHWSENTNVTLDKVDEEPLRVHLHAAMRFDHICSLRKDAELGFMDAFAVVQEVLDTRKRRRGVFNQVGSQAFFYCSVTKTSTVTAGGNYLPFKSYLVDTNWAVSLWQQGNISPATTRAVIVQCKKNVPNLLQNYEKVQKEESESQMELKVRTSLATLQGKMMPCRQLPVVNEWEDTFKHVSFRYNFLVLDGPSKTGKALYCRSRSLGSGGCLLEIDCAGADTPDMSNFCFEKHTRVLCDEGSAAMVLRYKKLFQASASFVRLGSSKTDCHAYNVWAHGTKFIVTSNRWWGEVANLPKEDSDWLWANSVYVHVCEPLWMPSPAAVP